MILYWKRLQSNPHSARLIISYSQSARCAIVRHHTNGTLDDIENKLYNTSASIEANPTPTVALHVPVGALVGLGQLDPNKVLKVLYGLPSIFPCAFRLL